MFSSYLYQGGAMSKQSDNRMDGPDIVVIGAGIIGITAAIELLSRGARVTVMDRTGVAAGAGKCGRLRLFRCLPARLAGDHS